MRRIMDDVVHLGESSECPPTQVPFDVYGDPGSEYVDDQPLLPFGPPTTRGGMHATSVPNSARSSSTHSQSQPAHPRKVCGLNWTDAEMLVLIGQKRIEWDGRHNCNHRLLPSSYMAPRHGNWCWPVAWVWWVSGPGIRTKSPTSGMA